VRGEEECEREREDEERKEWIQNAKAQNQMEAAEQAEQDIRRAAQKQESKPWVGWKAPPAGMIKCNWDAGRRMGVGIIFRTHEGEVMATECSTKPYITDPQTAEAVAAWTAANLVWQLELKDVSLEGDSLSVVQVLRS
jgi:hypothetical protein